MNEKRLKKTKEINKKIESLTIYYSFFLYGKPLIKENDNKLVHVSLTRKYNSFVKIVVLSIINLLFLVGILVGISIGNGFHVNGVVC